MKNQKNSTDFATKNIVLTALMTAFVVLFQLVGNFTTFFGPFTTALPLIPIVIGAALCGDKAGAWLGFVFGFVVLISGGATLFLVFNIPGTIITVLVKGIACGYAAGIVFKVLRKRNFYVAVITAALVCPIVNTGVFLLGCAIFFNGYATEIASKVDSPYSGYIVFLGLAFANFIFEIVINQLTCPIIVRILNIKKKK